MHDELLIGIAGIIGLGIAAQWLAWRLKLPSILLLLIFGFVAGPVTQFLHIDELFGELLFPIVSVSVAIILFEGGLSLRFADIKGVKRVLWRLLSVGVLVTWMATTLAAHFILGMDVSISLLIGAILVVTGPTVVIPLLKQIRPVGRVASILRWEGIVIDPVGAVMAVLVFEILLAADLSAGISQAVIGFFNTILIGLVIGFVVARLMILWFSRNWVPVNLQNPVSLMLLVAAFTVSNILQSESGLLTVTVMGVVMANQEMTISLGSLGKWKLGGSRHADLHHIIEFKENLQVLLISSLFIMLSARLRLEDFQRLGLADVLFVLVLILVVRPLSVWISVFRSSLNWKEKLFIAWMAPRGIVAAAVASIFALELAQHHHPGADFLVPVIFSVIVGTVIIYSLTAGALAFRLGIAQADPQGILFVGGQLWVRRIAEAVRDAGFRIMVVDTNYNNIQAARMEGLEVFFGSVLAQYTTDEIDLSRIGRILAMTSNDEVNALASLRFTKTFGRLDTYQLAPGRNGSSRLDTISTDMAGRYLFGPNVTFDYLEGRCRSGALVKATKLSAEFNMQAFRETHGENALLLFVVTPRGDLQVCTADDPPRLQAGATVISLVDLPADDPKPTTEERALIDQWQHIAPTESDTNTNDT